MPAAGSPPFDDVDLETKPNSSPAEEGFLAPTAPSRKSKKKKDKKNRIESVNYAETLYKTAQDEDSPYNEAVASTPPDEYGVSIQDEYPEPELASWVNGGPAALPDVESENEVKEVDPAETAEPSRKPQPHPPVPAVTSPRPAVARPVPNSFSPSSRSTSFYSPTQRYNQTGAYPTSRPTPQPRRESFATTPSPNRRFVEPVAPPHMAQPHFHGLPALGLNLGPKKDNGGKAAGSDGYCCCFDSFSDSGDLMSSKKAKTALLVGSEGGLDVFRVLPTKFEVVGRLEGLRGGVIGAKILPHVELYDGMQPMRPLVAVIVHGPITAEKRGFETDKESKERDAQDPPSHYQTTVEVYSLQTQQHIATLYMSALVAVEQPAIGHYSRVPAPVGGLSLAARGKYVVIASGASGEVFVFSYAATLVSAVPQFRCVGKFWTTLQQQLDSPSRPGSSDAGQPTDEHDARTGAPLFSLSQRWLAIVPPATSSHISIQGTPLLSEHNLTPPGLSIHVAPPQPTISCDVAGVDAEGAWGRLTRQAAQGVVKYSQKGIEMGWQGWRELTNPTTASGQQHVRTSSKEDQFPPTKAPPDDPSRLAKEPTLISIIDLETLLEAEEQKPKYAPIPSATFALQEGCNFLSFSSSGLRLLTVSRQGEMSTVWDLTQASHGLSGHNTAVEDLSMNGPCVKQIYRIPRSSQAIVVDGAWSRDDDSLALLTTHGTVHLHEVPSRPPSRKRKRRDVNVAPAPEKAQPTVSLSQGLSPPSSNGVLGSLYSWRQQASTQVSTIRSKNPLSSLGIPTSFAGFKEATANASHAGGRALARGLSQGYSAAKGGASDYWHAEDNKIRHKALQDQITPGSLRWIKRQSGTLLAIACGGTVHLHPVQRIERRKGDALVSGLKQDKYGQKHFELPPIRTSNDTVIGAQAKKSNDCASEGPHGFWSLRLSPPTEQSRISAPVMNAAPPPKANEVETNPPYCPFHIDSRVNIFAFGDAMAGSQINLLDEPKDSNFHVQGHGLSDEEVWIFGEPLPPGMKMNTHDELDDNFHEGVTDSDLEGLAQQVESRLTVHSASEPGGEQIRINTRRAQGRGMDSGEFGVLEDDDDDSMM
ncbi:hypothetical protein LTR37_014908 [Vermiconidia calcicola]|uniref:Uncharacterized protein n=1 Tax=Vermiconidia calcicola TaxID=1690605 RepID=A0ACC3MSI7_9PEZI|nr:hypothetical protein LTR37_014908 [Vermiconidia calcicola]